jgi:hypothetical protein
MAQFGIPYQGSKDKIIHKIASIFPKADHFYDLFGGGFSVTHYMLLFHATKYKQFHFNELESSTVTLIKDAISGRYSYDVFKPKWIDRATFERDKNHDAYTRIIWSFGNNQKGYIFGKEIESDKRSLHQAIIFDEWDSNAVAILGISKWPSHLSIRGRRLMCRTLVRARGERLDLERLEQLERLQRLQQLERLQRLQRLEQLELTSLSYDQVTITPNSIIYCDPPYKGTAGYVSNFDHDKFWQWVRNHQTPIFISEYQAPPDIKTIMAIRHQKTNSQTSTESVEKLFANQAAINAML